VIKSREIRYLSAVRPPERCLMETEKILCYASMAVAGIVALIFLLDLALGLFGRVIIMDILFILGAAFILWQGFETARELR
jgi:hypothetical protein